MVRAGFARRRLACELGDHLFAQRGRVAVDHVRAVAGQAQHQLTVDLALTGAGGRVPALKGVNGGLQGQVHHHGRAQQFVVDELLHRFRGGQRVSRHGCAIIWPMICRCACKCPAYAPLPRNECGGRRRRKGPRLSTRALVPERAADCGCNAAAISGLTCPCPCRPCRPCHRRRQTSVNRPWVPRQPWLRW